jgi:FAD:protein FMN transferase
MIQRARPLLGTIVSISADAPVLDAAFAAIERVHGLMSAQQSESDIGRVNREAHRAPVAVHAWTYEVIERALDISERSGGSFDIVRPGTGARWTDVLLEAGTVRLRSPARIDVSGIAKGFAVDRAVDALRAHGASSGSVNAGGDLRFFGDWPRAVRVRCPGALERAACLPASRHEAFATSSGYFGTTLDDPRAGGASELDWSVTVAASTCLVADALTKVLALVGPASSLLADFGAQAFAIDRNGRVYAAAA